MMRLLALACVLAACSAPVIVPAQPVVVPGPPPPSALELAGRQLATQKIALQAEIIPLMAQLALLAQWDAAGDTPVTLVPDVAGLARQLPAFAKLQAQCRAAPPVLVDRFDEESLAIPCGLATRAREIVEQQYLAAAKRAVRFPENLFDAAKRYRRQGRVAWQTLRIFQRLESDMAERTAWLKPVAQQLGLPILGELFHEGFAARRELRAAIRAGRTAWPLPGDVTDVAFVREVTPLVAELAQDGPMPGQRGQLLEVRAIDGKWAVRTLDGHAVRRERRLAALWRPAKGACIVTWLQASQLPHGRKWQTPTLWQEDDLRLVRCPSQ